MTGAWTLARDAPVRGVGLFTGVEADVVFRPARAGQGLVFRRTDQAGAPSIPASVLHVPADPRALGLPMPMPARCTILAVGRSFIVTTEHVLSALAGLGVTDAVIDVSGPEVPAFDGSASPFVESILAAGLLSLGPGPEPLVVTAPVRVGGEREGTVEALPRSSPGCSFRYELDYGATGPIHPQAATWSPGEDYAAGVAPARTFCLAREAEVMRAAGLFRHLTPRDMLVIGPDGPVENTYRFENEPARHKLLDLIGDLALVGRPLQADIVARRSGHALNHALARILLGVPDA